MPFSGNRFITVEKNDKKVGLNFITTQFHIGNISIILSTFCAYYQILIGLSLNIIFLSTDTPLATFVVYTKFLWKLDNNVKCITLIWVTLSTFIHIAVPILLPRRKNTEDCHISKYTNTNEIAENLLPLSQKFDEKKLRSFIKTSWNELCQLRLHCMTTLKKE